MSNRVRGTITIRDEHTTKTVEALSRRVEELEKMVSKEKPNHHVEKEQPDWISMGEKAKEDKGRMKKKKREKLLAMVKGAFDDGHISKEDYETLVAVYSKPRGRIKATTEDVAKAVLDLSGAVLHITNQVVKLEALVKKQEK